MTHEVSDTFPVQTPSTLQQAPRPRPRREVIENAAAIQVRIRTTRYDYPEFFIVYHPSHHLITQPLYHASHKMQVIKSMCILPLVIAAALPSTIQPEHFMLECILFRIVFFHCALNL
jgi:hypothetical protein